MRIIILLSVSLSLCCCTSSLDEDWTRTGYSGKSFSKIAVVGVSEEPDTRRYFEKVAVQRFVKHGIKAIEGVEVFPIDMAEEEKQIANYIRIIKENQVDAVVTMSLIDAKESMKFEEENEIVITGYQPFGRYYHNRQRKIEVPGYYVTERSYVIEAVLHDLEGDFEGKETLVWRGRSGLVNPTSMENAAENFTKKMVEHMVGNRIVTAE